MDTETTLTFWTWVPDIKNEVKLFTTKYPKIKVDVVNVGQGAPHYQKLRTAIQSGQGAPDVAQVEFQYIPSFTLGEGNLLDLTPYAPTDHQGQLRRTGCGARSTPTVGCGVSRRTPGRWACSIARTCCPTPASRRRRPTTTSPPQRRPTTPRIPKSYLVNVAPNQPGQLVAYLWQAGVRPFSFDGKETVKIDLASDEAKKVVKFWGDLVTNGVASNDPDFNDSWYQGLANGKWATLADRRLGTGVPAGHGRQDLGQVAGRRPAAVGCQHRPCRATGADPPTRC